MGCPCDEIVQVAEYWGVAGCSPKQSSLAAVPLGICHIFAFVIYLLGLTPCALNVLPHHGIQVQSQKVLVGESCTAVNDDGDDADDDDDDDKMALMMMMIIMVVMKVM